MTGTWWAALILVGYYLASAQVARRIAKQLDQRRVTPRPS